MMQPGEHWQSPSAAMIASRSGNPVTLAGHREPDCRARQPGRML
jgi:hypothetical protein